MSKQRRTVLSGIVTPLVRDAAPPPAASASADIVDLPPVARRRSATKDATVQQTVYFAACRSRPAQGTRVFRKGENAHPHHGRAGRGVSRARDEVDCRSYGQAMIPLQWYHCTMAAAQCAF